MTSDNLHSQNEIVKRTENLFNSLQKNTNSIFYLAGNTITKTLINKASRSVFDKDRVFVDLYKQIEDKKKFKNTDLLPITTPFYESKSNVDHSTLFSISKPFELLHGDIADTRFLAKSAVDPKYCLLLVDLFTSKVYIYPMKNRSLLAKKLKLFYDDIQSKRSGLMKLQTDLEFKQNEIKKLNEEYDVEMFHTRVRGGKAFAAEQKIGQFKKLLLKGKRLEKESRKRLKPLQLISNVTKNMNNTISTKYGMTPESIEQKSLANDGDYFTEVYDFLRVRKIGTQQARNMKYDLKKDRRKKQLRSPLNIGEKVLILAERIKKKDAPGFLFKTSTENRPFFNREHIFTIIKRSKLNDGSYLYWLAEEGRKIEGRFLREEIFALNNQFVK